MILGIAFTDIVFYIVAAFMIIAAICTVVSKNVLRSAVYLIATFIGTAIFYILLQAEFMAIAQIMVYAGGVVIFIIFAILLTAHLGEDSLKTPVPKKFIALILALALIGVVTRLLIKAPDVLHAVPQNTITASSLTEYATRLLSPAANGLLIPFELISILLLTALIVSVTIAKDKEEK